AASPTIRYQPGLISGSDSRGVSGAYVADCVQWRSQEDFARMWRQPHAQQHVAEVHTVAKGNPQLFELCNQIDGIPQELADNGKQPGSAVLSAEHDIVISKSWEQCFELCSCL